MIRHVLNRWSPAGDEARLSTLIFHRVHRQVDPLAPGEVDAAAFASLCAWLCRWFNVLPLEEATQRLQERSLPARALAITFDDGYADNHDVALPILRKHDLTATFFVATGFLDGGRMWNDTLVEAVRLTGLDELDLADAGLPGIGRLVVASVDDKRAAIGALIRACRYLPGPQRQQAIDAVATVAHVQLPTDLMMTSQQVINLHRSGMSIGGHTVNHPILARQAPAQARDEIRLGKSRLEELTQSPVELFAYPNGRPADDFHREHVEMVRELGFKAAVTTAWGTSGKGSDKYQMPRFTPWDRSRWRFGMRMLRNLNGRGDHAPTYL